MTATGISEPYTDETLSCAVAGTVGTVHVREGERVTAGQILVELDAALEELEVARRKLAWESRVELEAAEARLAAAAEDLETTRGLYETTQSVSRDDLRLKELEHRLAAAEVERLSVVETREEIEYQMALERLKQRTLRAPNHGIVAALFLEEGENCEARQPLVRLVQVRRCYLVVNLDAALVRPLRVGHAVTVELLLGDAVIPREGTIEFIAPVVDAASGLQEIKVVFDNSDGAVWPGVAGRLYLPQAADER